MIFPMTFSVFVCIVSLYGLIYSHEFNIQYFQHRLFLLSFILEESPAPCPPECPTANSTFTKTKTNSKYPSLAPAYKIPIPQIWLFSSLNPLLLLTLPSHHFQNNSRLRSILDFFFFLHIFHFNQQSYYFTNLHPQSSHNLGSHCLLKGLLQQPNWCSLCSLFHLKSNLHLANRSN